MTGAGHTIRTTKALVITVIGIVIVIIIDKARRPRAGRLSVRPHRPRGPGTLPGSVTSVQVGVGGGSFLSRPTSAALACSQGTKRSPSTPGVSDRSPSHGPLKHPELPVPVVPHRTWSPAGWAGLAAGRLGPGPSHALSSR